MRTVILPDPPPVEFAEMLERRRQAGADRHDEVWEGVLHMAPAPHFRHADLQAQLMGLLGPPARAASLRLGADFNLGDPDDYRVPDGGLLQPGPAQLYAPTAKLVLEIISPGDETFSKLPFYATHEVEELLIVDPEDRIVHWLALDAGEYRPVQRSRVIDLGAEELAGRIAWPDC